MKQVELLNTYFQERKNAGISRNCEPFVTISREAGAGGSRLAEELMRQLAESDYRKGHAQWKSFNQEITEIILNEPDITTSMYSLETEEYHSELVEVLKGFLSNVDSDQYTVYKRTCEVLRFLASLGRVVLVGRGARYVTKDMPGGIHIRLTADHHTRIQRMTELLQLDSVAARQAVDKQDHDRKKRVKDFFGKDIDDPSNYDKVYNSCQTSMGDMASEILAMVDEKILKLKP